MRFDARTSLARVRSAIVERDEKIERLEAELAKVKHERYTSAMHYEAVIRRSNAINADLEAELADLRRHYETAIEQVDVLRTALRIECDELADLRASSVVVRERCETCFDGLLCVGADPHDHYDGCRCPEPDCVGGWRLAEGVEWLVEYQERRFMDPGYFVPARLIEGDT